MAKKMVSFRAPEHIVDKVMGFKDRHDFEYTSDAFNFILEDYFRLKKAVKETAPGVQSNGFSKSVVEDLDSLKSVGDEIKKMLLVIGHADPKSASELEKHFPQYFRKV